MATQHGRKTAVTGSVNEAKLDKLAETLKRLPTSRQQKAMTLLDRDEDTALATALKAAITASDRTHYSIGKEAGVAPDMLDRFMSGERDLRLASAGKIARALNLALVTAKLPTMAVPTMKRSEKETSKQKKKDAS